MGSANLWVLDFLLEADGLDDTLIKHFHDVNANQFEELPPNTQARLMLRVLRDAPAQPTGIAEAALGALNMLKNLAEQLPENFAPGANLEALKPSPHLFTEVKTELVLKSLRDGNQGEHPRVILDTFFVPPEQGGILDPMELDRRNEILEGLKGPEQAQQILAKYPVAQLNHTLLSFVASARAALGPNMLKLVEKDIVEGRYNPHQGAQGPAGSQAGAKRRRTKAATTTEEDAAGMLANMSQSNAVLAAAGGQDPLAGAMQAGQDGSKHPGEQATHLSNPDGTPLPSNVAIVGTPVDGNAAAPSPADSQGNRTKSGQPPRRRNGRWNEEETAYLIRHVREQGKGKWKKILESGGPIFQNRSQVDLKDKWRNLERQGVVGPQDLPPQPVPQLQSQVQLQSLGQQLGPDGHLMGPAMLNHDGQPLTEAQAQQYAAFAAQYAAQIAANQQQQHHISPELLQQHMAQMQQMAPQGLQGLPPQMLAPEQSLPGQGQSQQPDGHPGQQQHDMHADQQQAQPQQMHQLQHPDGQAGEEGQAAQVQQNLMTPKSEDEKKSLAI